MPIWGNKWVAYCWTGCIWLPRGSLWLPMGSIWLLRGCFWVPLGLHMAAQRLHMAAHGAAYGCSEAAFGCRGVAFCCTGAVYGSHAADMQYMLHLAGPGWLLRAKAHLRRLNCEQQLSRVVQIHRCGDLANERLAIKSPLSTLPRGPSKLSLREIAAVPQRAHGPLHRPGHRN